MNLTRDRAAEVNSGSKTTELPKIRLRGSIFYYTPRPQFIPQVDRTAWPTIELIYRGSIYQRQIKPLKLGQSRYWRC
jgi:hypothetical protein